MRTLISFLFCSLLLVSVSSRSIRSVEDDDPIDVLATWNDFQTRHVVAGTAPTTVSGWNALLKERIGSQYGSKSINSFVVSTTDAILEDFSAGSPPYNGGSGSNLYWSKSNRRIYVMTLSGSSYLVYDCNRKYYVTGLNMNTRYPEHLEGQATNQGPNLDAPTQGCTRLTN